jgi:hypothetical protein
MNLILENQEMEEIESIARHGENPSEFTTDADWSACHCSWGNCEGKCEYHCGTNCSDNCAETCNDTCHKNCDTSCVNSCDHTCSHLG